MAVVSLGLGIGIGLRKTTPISSGPAPFSGSAFSYLPCPAYCRSDASNTIPCANGDAIRWFYDPVTATWYEQATSGARLILRADGSKWYAEGAVGRFHRFANLLSSAQHTIAYASQATVSAGDVSTAIGNYDATTNNANWSFASTVGTTTMRFPQPAQGLTLPQTYANVKRRIICTQSATDCKIYSDTVNNAPATGTTFSTQFTANYSVGRNGNLAEEYFLGRLYALVLINSAVSGASVTALDTYLNGFLQ